MKVVNRLKNTEWPLKDRFLVRCSLHHEIKGVNIWLVFKRLIALKKQKKIFLLTGSIDFNRLI